MLKKLIILQNIITSYRIDVFGEINSQVKSKNIGFDVYYFKEKYKGRYLPFDIGMINYSYKIWGGLFLLLKGYKFHLNPAMLWKLITENNETAIVMGSSWNNFNVMLLVFFKKIGIVRAKLFLWSEANYMTKGATKKNKLKELVRDFVFKNVDGGYVIPGQVAAYTINDVWGYQNNIVMLPNLIYGEYFNGEKDFGIKRVISLLTVSRIDELDKGLIRFIDMCKELLVNFKWTIAGDGPDRMRLEEKIRESGLLNNIKLLGNIPKEEIRKEMLKHDVFLLPSISDPNPISIVEALHAGMPLCMSKRCGNVNEAINKNGYILDPFDKESVCKALCLLEKNKNSLNLMSEESRNIARTNFDLQGGVKIFIQKMIEIC